MKCKAALNESKARPVGPYQRPRNLRALRILFTEEVTNKNKNMMKNKKKILNKWDIVRDSREVTRGDIRKH